MLLLAGGLHLPAAAVAGDKVTVPLLLKVLGGEPIHSSNCILYMGQGMVHLQKHLGGIHVQSTCADVGFSLLWLIG